MDVVETCIKRFRQTGVIFELAYAYLPYQMDYSQTHCFCCGWCFDFMTVYGIGKMAAMLRCRCDLHSHSTQRIVTAVPMIGAARWLKPLKRLEPRVNCFESNETTVAGFTGFWRKALARTTMLVFSFAKPLLRRFKSPRSAVPAELDRQFELLLCRYGYGALQI